MVIIFEDKNQRFTVRYEDRPHALVYKSGPNPVGEFCSFSEGVNISIMQALFWWTDSSSALKHSKSYSIQMCVCVCVCERIMREKRRRKESMRWYKKQRFHTQTP